METKTKAASTATTKDANNTIGTPNVATEQVAANPLTIEKDVPLPAAKPLSIVVNKTVAEVEFNGNVATTEEEMVTAIRQYIRNKVLNQFGVVEVAKNTVTGGKLYLNGNRTGLKLPKVEVRANGSWAETLPQYYNRIKPELEKWLLQSMQNSTITMEMVGNIA